MSNEQVTAVDWADIGRRFRAPFNPADVDFRPQSGKANGKSQAVCYVSARVVQERLDEVVGPGNWSFTFEPIVVANGQVQIAKGRLVVHGIAKEDAGEANNFDPSKACVSDAIKRAAVMWGIGRYLYDISSEWVTLNQYSQITPEDMRKLRAMLPRPDGSAPQPQQQQQQRTHVIEQATQIAQEAAPRKTTHASASAPNETASKETLSAIAKACNLLGVAMPTDITSEADAQKRLELYRVTWRKQQQEQQQQQPEAQAEAS